MGDAAVGRHPDESRTALAKSLASPEPSDGPSTREAKFGRRFGAEQVSSRLLSVALRVRLRGSDIGPGISHQERTWDGCNDSGAAKVHWILLVRPRSSG